MIISCYKKSYKGRFTECLNVKVMDMSIPLPPTSIELSPQFTRNGLQMHEVTEATTSALSVERRQIEAIRSEKNMTAGQDLELVSNGKLFLTIGFELIRDPKSGKLNLIQSN